MPAETRNKIGLILSGGGARAAYQVGVLRAIAEVLPKDAANPFHIICGTSAGALNAVSLATHAHRLRTGVRSLEYVWKNLHSGQVYRLDSTGIIARASGWMLSTFSTRKADAPVSLLDNEPLSELLSRVIKFDRIQRNIDTGFLDGVSVTSSNYTTGESVSFYQAIKGIGNWQGPHRVGLRSKLTLSHLMASSAIPTMFPAVNIGEHYFGDGAIRQLAPTSTPIHMGARRICAIGVAGHRSPRPTDPEALANPSLSQIIGHILNSAFVDTLENDLEFLRHMNEVLPHVPRRILRKENIRHREVELLEIAPSKDLPTIATEHFSELPKAMRFFIKEASSGTLLSLLLFEPGYCQTLMQLGYEDAMAQEEKIRYFFRET
ncbi:MAG: patatin-like phospholipase family protein [Pseudohongiellaceae bacterium]